MSSENLFVSRIETARGPITIRPADGSDGAALRELRLAALKAHPTAFGSDYESTLARPAEHWAERFRNGASDPHTAMFVAESAAGFVGMMSVGREQAVKVRHSATIYAVYVSDAWRGAGVADALIGACIAWARSRGVRQLKLGVNIANMPAIRCYTRCGFKIYGIEPEVIHHEGVYHDELLMVQKIAD